MPIGLLWMFGSCVTIALTLNILVGNTRPGVFQSALGWTAASAEDVRRKLLEAVQREEASDLGSDDYGKRYALDFSAPGLLGSVTVRSLWIVRRLEDFPRFTSCYIL